MFSFSAEANESAIRTSFHPYSQGGLRIPGLEPGRILTVTDAQVAREVLPDEILRLVTAGDLEIPLQETTDLPPRPAYLNATSRHAPAVSFDGGHTLVNYQAGAPFPLLTPTDPQAGEKLAWNLRDRDLGESFELRANPRQLNASGGVEHSNRGHIKIRFGLYRPDPTNNDPQWQAQGVYMKNSFELLAPSDQEGIISLRTFYDDDGRQTEQWRYSPQNCRTRKDTVNSVTPIGGYYEMRQEEQPPFFFHMEEKAVGVPKFPGNCGASWSSTVPPLIRLVGGYSFLINRPAHHSSHSPMILMGHSSG